MRILFSLLLVGLSFTSYTQSTYWVGVNGTAQFNQFEYIKGTLVQGPVEGAPKANWTAFGVSVRSQTEGKWSYLLGVNYASELFRVSYVFDPPITGNDPFVPTGTDVTYSYIDIPLEVSYQFTKAASFEVLGFGGLNYSALLNTKEETKMQDESMVESEYFSEYKPSNLLQAKIGVQARYNFSDNVRISLNPYAGFGLIQNTEDYGKKKPFSYGATLLLEYGM